LEIVMAHPLTLPTVAGLALLGSATGIYLGNSAISQINPAYYSEPETRFHSDLTPYRSPDWAQVQVTEYGDAGLIEGLGTGCIGCRAYPEEYIPRHDPAIDGATMDGTQDGWSASTGVSPAEVQAAVAEAPIEPEWQQVQRYAAYQVGADSRTGDRADDAAEAAADDEALRAEAAPADEDAGTE
jgi:hypothetical protein